jgi:signal transduction histidine kinase
MLHEFVTLYRDAIITKARAKLTARPWPSASANELESGVPLFLTQLSETLRQEAAGTPYCSSAIGDGATRHGRELLALGFTVSEVVHDYGDICQAVTELAMEQHVPITTEEFHTLNRCLDTAIAEAVTEHARISAESRSSEDVERSGQVAHETRDLLHTALFAFQALKRGTVAINGSTGAVLGRSLMGLRDLVDSTLADIKVAAKHGRRERVSVASFLEEIAVAAGLHAEYRGLRFSVEPVDPSVMISVDSQLLGSAVMNLLNNAFKYTRPGGRVVLRVQRNDDRVLIEIEDECGGIPESTADLFQSFGDRRGADRSGLGLGLSIARKAVRAQGGDVRVRNMPGKGCVFAIDIPLAVADTPTPQSAA